MSLQWTLWYSTHRPGLPWWLRYEEYACNEGDPGFWSLCQEEIPWRGRNDHHQAFLPKENSMHREELVGYSYGVWRLDTAQQLIHHTHIDWNRSTRLKDLFPKLQGKTTAKTVLSVITFQELPWLRKLTAQDYAFSLQEHWITDLHRVLRSGAFVLNLYNSWSTRSAFD